MTPPVPGLILVAAVTVCLLALFLTRHERGSDPGDDSVPWSYTVAIAEQKFGKVRRARERAAMHRKAIRRARWQAAA